MWKRFEKHCYTHDSKQVLWFFFPFALEETPSIWFVPLVNLLPTDRMGFIGNTRTETFLCTGSYCCPVEGVRILRGECRPPWGRKEGRHPLHMGWYPSSFLPWASPLSLPRMAPWLISGAAGVESARRALVSAKKWRSGWLISESIVGRNSISDKPPTAVTWYLFWCLSWALTPVLVVARPLMICLWALRMCRGASRVLSGPLPGESALSLERSSGSRCQSLMDELTTAL